MQLKIYNEQLKGGEKPHPFNYMPDDILYRFTWFIGDDEPPLSVLYPLILKTEKGYVIDPLTVHIGRTASNKLFAYNPRYVVNPLILVVGTPGAGKSLHPDEPVLVIRDGAARSMPVKDAEAGDYTFAVDEEGNVYLSEVLGVFRHKHSGELYRVKFIGPHGEGTVTITPDHSLLKWDNGRIVPVRGDEVEKGDKLPVLNVNPLVDFAEVIDIKKIPYKGYVYDIETVHNTFMLANGLFVHNSATLKTFIYNFMRNADFMDRSRIPPIIVVDPEGEYDVLKQHVNPADVLHLRLGRRDYINIFDRPSKTINPMAWYMRILPVIQKFLHLSPGQAAQAYRVLKKAIKEVAEKKGITSDPATWLKPDITLEDVYKWIDEEMSALESKKKMEPAERLFYRGSLTLMSRLDQWMNPPNDAFTKRSTVDLSKIFRYRLIILDARGLSKDLFGLFSYWITYWIYGLMLEKGPLPSFGIRVVLIIDEAWALLRKTESKEEENPLEALARRGRKYGILIVVATQTPEDVDKKMFSLFGTLVTGIIPSDEMRNKIVQSRGMPERFKEIIGRLAQGQLVWHINWRKRNFPMSGMPIIVKTDYPIRDLVQIQPL